MLNSKNKIKKQIIENLKTIFDPEIPVNIYDLGLIYKIDVTLKNDNNINCDIDMTLTSPACPVAEGLVEQARNVVVGIEEITNVNINLIFDPPWDMTKMSEDARDIMMTSGVNI